MLATPRLTDARILVVDDERVNVVLLERILEQDGYRNVKSLTDPSEVVALYDQFEPDLVLLDLHMPKLDGFAVMKLLEDRISSDTFLPILILTDFAGLIDVALIDLHFPDGSGLEIVREVHTNNPRGQILILTADIRPEIKRRALSAGAKDFVTKPFDRTEVLLRIQNLLETRFLHLRMRHDAVPEGQAT